MKTKLIIGVLLLFAALLILPAAAAAADETAPVLPLQVYGTVSYTDGENLPVGTVVTATVDGLTSTFTVTEAGKIGGPGTFDAKFLINGTANGSTISFKINGLSAAVTGGCTFASGDVKQIALTTEKKEATVVADAGSKETFKEKPVIVGVSGDVPADFNPDTFKLTISVIPETQTLPATPEKAEVFKAIEITSSQQGVSVLIPITITDTELREHFENDRSTVAVYHHNGTLWEKIPVRNFDIKTGETVFWIQADSFSPYIIVSETAGAEPTTSPTMTPTATPTPTSPSTGGGSKSNAQDQTPTSAVTPNPTPAAQTPGPVAGDTSSVKPIGYSTQQSKSPAPILGILAGLGAAALLFAARQRR